MSIFVCGTGVEDFKHLYLIFIYSVDASMQLVFSFPSVLTQINSTKSRRLLQITSEFVNIFTKKMKKE